MRYYEDPILGKGRAADISGGTGGSGTTYIGGFAIGISGETISRLRYMPIESVTGNSVTLQAGHAYKAYATSTAITLNTETVPEGQFGLEGHIEIYVAGTGYVVTGTNVVLANALEPDSVNNCTLRFHDGVCIISVEDHVAGYIVVNGSTAGSGSLYYGITTSTNDYVAFDASLNGTTIPLAGAVAEGEKHVVGNGYTETAITGAVDCGTSKFTVANLGLQNVQVTGGTMTLGDAYIPSGSTVAVSGGGLAVEKVTGDGGVIDLGGTNVIVSSGATANATGCTFQNGLSQSYGGSFNLGYSNASLTLTSCVFTNNTTTGGYENQGRAIYVAGSNVLTLSNCTFNSSQSISLRGGAVTIAGSNTIDTINAFVVATPGYVTISSGAIVDLTGNTNATPIAPGGVITFAEGGATVQLGSSAGTVDSSYMMDNVTLPAGAKLTNTAVVDLGGTHVFVSSGTTASASGCTFSGGSDSNRGGAFQLYTSSYLELTSCTITGCSSFYGGGFAMGCGCVAKLSSCIVTGNAATSIGGGAHFVGGRFELTDCIISGNTARSDQRGFDLYIQDGATVTLTGTNTVDRITFGNSGTLEVAGNASFTKINTGGGGTESGSVVISSGASINLTSSINPGGGITVLTGGCTVNGNAIPAGTYTSIDSTGTPT